jgi:hypothetical protein
MRNQLNLFIFFGETTMRPFLQLSFLVFILTFALVGQQEFQRTFEIQTSDFEVGGFGNIIAGVDFDGDGLPEIYLCNTNMIDRDEELIPRLYKFEWNPITETWDNVWTAISDIPLQNTWPALTWGDLDGDGKPEIYWGPVNFTSAENPNPARILVYEYPGDGSDDMGVADGLGGYLPNAQWTIVDADNFNLRPIRFIIKNIGGQDKLIFADRAAQSGGFHYGVISVDDIPDFGGGTETWTLEASGVDDPILNDPNVSARNKWDLAIVGDIIYLFAENGLVYPIKYDGQDWVTLTPLAGVGGGYGSFKGSVTYDLDGDGIDEIVVGSWFTGGVGRVYLLKQDADTLLTYQIADLGALGASRLVGAGVGDVDGDGNPDFIFGSRHPSVPNNSLYRVKYLGGDITDPASYEASIIDSLLVPGPGGLGGDLDVIAVANIDGDPVDEIIYTQGYTRGVANDTTANVPILDLEFTPVSVKLVDTNIPDHFYLDQNYPNPFNPATTIRFGLTVEMVVELKVYDLLGKEVMTLINNDLMSAGSYDVTFDASRLASGSYYYRLKVGDNVLSKKMILLK